MSKPINKDYLLTQLKNFKSTILDPIFNNKMDKTNPRGTGSFAMNQDDENKIGDNSFTVGGSMKETSASGYKQTCTITYDSETDTTVTYLTGEDLTLITDIVINRVATNTWTKLDVDNITSTTITVKKISTVTDYTVFNKLNGIYHYGMVANDVRGKSSASFGVGNTSSGAYSFTMGEYNQATAADAAAFGINSKATGELSFAEGEMSEASGYASHAEGTGSKASGYISHAENYQTKATANYTHSEGYQTEATNAASHAEGYKSKATGYVSHAEGNESTSGGSYSHAEGYHTKATGSNSHAEGYMTETKGQNHAEGMYTIAYGDGQHVEGLYNIEDIEEKYLHIVGNGNYNNRSNAMTVDRQGNTWTAGNYTFGNNKVVGEEHEVKLVEDYWCAEPAFEDWTNYLKNSLFVFSKGNAITYISEETDPIVGTVQYNIPTGWNGINYTCQDSEFLSSLAGKTLEMGSITYNKQFVQPNTVIIRYKVDGSDYVYNMCSDSALNTGSQIVKENVSGLAYRFTVPENLNYLGFLFVQSTHNAIAEAGTFTLGNAYVIDINEHELPDRNNTYVKMKRINESNPTNLDINTMTFNKADNKIYFTNNTGDAVVFDGNATPPEIAVSTSEPEGDEVLWINPNDPGTPGTSLWESGTGLHSVQTKNTGASAVGQCSVAEGLNTIANSNYSHAEGITSKTVVDTDDTEFHGYASHAEGAYTTAKGAASHAEGDGTLAIAMHSHAEGRTTTTGGIASHAEGSNTITNNFGEHAEGVYNKSNMASSTFGNAGNTIHSIGIGHSTGELEDDRKNAVEVMQNGDVYIIGIGGYDGTNVSSAQSIQEVIASLIPKK